MLPLGLFPSDTQKALQPLPNRPKAPLLDIASKEQSSGDWLARLLPSAGYFFGRLLTALATFFIITTVIYGISLLVPADDRARLYLPPRIRYDEASSVRFYLDQIIEEQGFNDPFPVQYGRWLGKLVQGDWGESSSLRTPVLEALRARSPATLELTIFSILIYVPTGLLLGGFIAWQQGRLVDHIVRLSSFVIAAIPPFVLGFVLIAIIYVQMGFLDLSRIGYAERAILQSDQFFQVTGLITVDGLLNLRFDIVWEAIRHLIMPLVTLVAFYLATLVLVTRASVTEELQKEYVLLAKGMGLRDRKILFTYALRNAMLPGLTHSALSAAQLITGVFVVEVIFNWHGVSELLIDSMGSPYPDVDLALGFCVYSVIVVLSIVFILDLIQGLVDPRVRMGKE